MRGLERELMEGRGRGGEVSGAAGRDAWLPRCQRRRQRKQTWRQS